MVHPVCCCISLITYMFVAGQINDIKLWITFDGLTCRPCKLIPGQCTIIYVLCVCLKIHGEIIIYDNHMLYSLNNGVPSNNYGENMFLASFDVYWWVKMCLNPDPSHINRCELVLQQLCTKQGGTWFCSWFRRFGCEIKPTASSKPRFCGVSGSFCWGSTLWLCQNSYWKWPLK